MTTTVALICVTVLGVAAVIGILVTKIEGWGKHSTSAFLLTIALFITADLLVLGKLEATQSANLFFAIIGFAGGLIASKKEDG
jgi:hypothetical protein